MSKIQNTAGFEAKEIKLGSFSTTMSTSLDSLTTLENGDLNDEKKTSGRSRASILVYAACLAAQMSAIMMGVGFGWSAAATEEMDPDNTATVDLPFHCSATERNFVASMLTLGAFVGAFFCGFAIDFLGRRWTLILLGVPYFVGWLTIALSKSLVLILIGRFLSGFPIGITTGVLPTYIAEISTPNIRGFLGMLFNFFVVSGILYLNILNVLGFHWNTLAFWSMGPAALLSFSMFFMPESPIYLINSNRDHSKKGTERAIEAAAASLKRLRTADSDVRGEARQLQENAFRARQSQKEKLKLRPSTLKRPDVYKPMLIGMALLFFQQFCGINAVQFYSNTIFKEAHTSIDPKIATLISNTFMLLATVVGSLIIDRFGRRALLIVSAFGLLASISVLGGYYFQHRFDKNLDDVHSTTTTATLKSLNTTQLPAILADEFSPSFALGNLLKDGEARKEQSILPLVCVAIFVASFSLGVGPICWIIITEITPPQTIGLITTTSSALAWVFTFAVVNNAKYFHDTLTPYGTYWMFAGISLVSAVFAWFLPETKGKTAEEIGKIFGYNQI